MRSPATIAVTGLGIVSPFGAGSDVLLRALLESQSAIRPLSVFDNPLDALPFVGQVHAPLDFETPQGFRLSRTDRIAIAAARQVVESLEKGTRRDCAVVVGTTVAGLDSIGNGIVTDRVAYYSGGGFGSVTTYPVSHVARAVAASLDLRGPHFGVSVACASGAIAIALGARMIEEGRVRTALVGGSDALCPFTLAGFNALQALDPNPCRPFSESRAGLNLGEASAMLLLEDPEHAKARGAPILAYLADWACTNDAFHPTAPDEGGRGLALCMSAAMARAGVVPDDIGYVNAHGTGTRLNDVSEIRAYESAFAGRKSPIPVSSTKGHIGHTLGAAGAIEAAITILSLRSGTLFPTLRLDTPIETRAVDLLQATRPTNMTVAMSVSAGFGGSNASLVFRRGED